MFPLCRWAFVDSTGGPLVIGIDDSFSSARVDHRFDGKGHAGCQLNLAGVAMVGDLRLFMETDTMSDKLIDNRTAMFGGDLFDLVANFINFQSRLAKSAAFHQTLKRSLHDSLLFLRDFADSYHAAAVAVVFVKNAGNIDIDNIAFFKRNVIGNAVADNFVKRSADTLG